jgi:hypothetical protein
MGVVKNRKFKGKRKGMELANEVEVNYNAFPSYSLQYLIEIDRVGT